MSEKITPATKKVAKADGLKQGTANTTLTTPSQEKATDGKFYGGQKNPPSIFK